MNSSRRDLGVLSVIVLAVGALLGLVLARVLDMSDRLDEATSDRSALAEDVVALRSQLIGLGEKPKVAPPTEGERGEPGSAGKDGRDGIDGADGRDGRDGVDGRDGAPGPRGPAGLVGPPGPAGADGTDGAIGEPGPVGPAGADGAPGPAGPQGEPGATGPQGPAVQSFTFTWANQTYTCTDPDGDGAYACESPGGVPPGQAG